MRRAAAPLACLLLAACNADLTEPWRVIEPRLMAARVEVEGDATRPRPRLEERFALRQYIAVPSTLKSPLASRYAIDAALCLGFKSADGQLRCIGEQELSPTVTPISETEVLLSGLGIDLAALGVDPAQLVGKSFEELPEGVRTLDRLALFGALCVDGKVERVEGKSIRSEPPSQLFRCVDNAGAAFPDPSAFTISVLLDRGRSLDKNQNPTFACDASRPDSVCNVGVERGGEPRVPGAFVLALPEPDRSSARDVRAWPAPPARTPLPWDNCAADDSMPHVRAGTKKHIVRVRFDPGDRESYTYELNSNGELVTRNGREDLLVTHAVSSQSGELDRYDSKLFGDESDADAEISVAYTPPTLDDEKEQPIPPTGRVARFYFTLRDERGGVDFATRELCLLPSTAKE